MLYRSAFRAVAKPTAVARRGFQTTRTVRGGHGDKLPAAGASPYHYTEGPRSNLPFDPLKKGFAIKFWAYAITGFGLPFALAVWQTKKNK